MAQPYPTQVPMEGPSSQPYYPTSPQRRHYGREPRVVAQVPQFQGYSHGHDRYPNMSYFSSQHPPPGPGHNTYYPLVNPPWPSPAYPPQYFISQQYHPQNPHPRRNAPARSKRQDSAYSASPPHHAHPLPLATGNSPAKGSPKTSLEPPDATSFTNPGIEESSDTTTLETYSTETTSSSPIQNPVEALHPTSILAPDVSQHANGLKSPADSRNEASDIVFAAWCISKIKLKPSIAYSLTISPRAYPPAYVVEKAIVLDSASSTALETFHHELIPNSPKMPESVERLPPAERTPTEEKLGIVSEGPAPSQDIKTEVDFDLTVAVSEVLDNQDTVHVDVCNAMATTSSPKQAKSWASLLRSEPSSTLGSPSSVAHNALPVSSVVGFSIPASEPVSASVSNTSMILTLLTLSPKHNDNIMRIAPRGLVNLGNMCFANIILQVLTYTEPFNRLFEQLGSLIIDPLPVGGGCPLVDATIRFVREFAITSPMAGKNATRKVLTSNMEDDENKGPFVPQYVYDGLKENKRFDTMRGGQQEDAEEFLGFYLDTIEEELLKIIRTIGPDHLSDSSIVDEKTEDEDESVSDGWTEVGKRNRKIVTRGVKSTGTAISRIFGGSSRSTVRRPGNSDSVNVEVWRHLGLDIQSEQVHTVDEALQELSRPEVVQVSSTRGALVDGNKQYLIDSLPPILVLHIKRFQYDPLLKDVVKQRKTIHFSSELVVPKEIMTSHLRQQVTPRYKLYAVLYHHGVYATGGHYTLNVLQPNKSQEAWGKGWKEGWLHIDDEHISDVQINDVIGQRDAEDRSAYLLFYQRINPTNR